MATENRVSGQGPTSDMRQLVTAVIVTVISVGMLLGSFLLARLDSAPMPSTLTRSGPADSPLTPFLPSLTPQPSPTSTPTALAPEPPATSLPVEGETETEDLTASPTPTTAPPELPPTTTSCPRPLGWFIYTVRRGDTLHKLARRAGKSAAFLMRQNCLAADTLFPGQHLYLPPSFYPTPTPVHERCGPPMHWVRYRVQPGDTLYSLSLRCGVSVEDLRVANCLRGNDIYTGEVLFVPRLPPTPSPSVTLTATPSPSATATQQGTPTASPSPTFAPTSSPTSPSPTTPAASPTMTTLPTSTATPSRTPTTATPTGTLTPTPTGNSTPQQTSTPTPTIEPTATHTPTTPATATDLPTSTATPSSYSDG